MNKAKAITPKPNPINEDDADETIEVQLGMFEDLPIGKKKNVIKEVFGEIKGKPS